MEQKQEQDKPVYSNRRAVEKLILNKWMSIKTNPDQDLIGLHVKVVKIEYTPAGPEITVVTKAGRAIKITSFDQLYMPKVITEKTIEAVKSIVIKKKEEWKNKIGMDYVTDKGRKTWLRYKFSDLLDKEEWNKIIMKCSSEDVEFGTFYEHFLEALRYKRTGISDPAGTTDQTGGASW